MIPLSFSSNLDQFNPNIPEWREDVGQVVTKILAKVGNRLTLGSESMTFILYCIDVRYSS